MSIDKRHFTRYEVPENFLLIACRKSGKLAVVKNISTAGLAFEYSPIAGEKPDWTEIDIFTTNQNRLRLSKIPCKTIYDINVLPEHSTFIGSKARLAGLQYVGFSNEQQKKIKHLIDFGLSRPLQD